MNFELLDTILKYIDTMTYRKYRNQKLAKMVRKLKAEYDASEDQKRKYEIRREIHKIIYRIFNGCLHKKTREELSNIGCTINEYCYQIEHKENNGWNIGNDAAKRYVPSEGKVVQVASIPREYKKGFYLEESEINTEAEKKNKIIESNFYYQYVDYLNRISDLMDRKSDIITYEYVVADPSVDRTFVELLIDFLGFSRVTDTKKKEQGQELKKVNKS